MAERYILIVVDKTNYINKSYHRKQEENSPATDRCKYSVGSSIP